MKYFVRWDLTNDFIGRKTTFDFEKKTFFGPIFDTISDKKNGPKYTGKNINFYGVLKNCVSVWICIFYIKTIRSFFYN